MFYELMLIATLFINKKFGLTSKTNCFLLFSFHKCKKKLSVLSEMLSLEIKISLNFNIFTTKMNVQ
ncbi:hypothetical protein PR729_27075 [Providencia rettgeri]|nr:hypothetical protein PR729_27075 [Providencia rettgeri]